MLCERANVSAGQKHGVTDVGNGPKCPILTCVYVVGYLRRGSLSVEARRELGQNVSSYFFQDFIA